MTTSGVLGWLESRRTSVASVLMAVAVLAPTIAWYITGSREASRQAQDRVDRAIGDLEAQVTFGAQRLGERLESMRVRESMRPFYHYQNLYHDPRGAAQGLAVTTSPLARGASDPLIWAHFQIDELGAVSLPTVSERFPELSTDEGFSHFCRVLTDLQNGFVVARLDTPGVDRVTDLEDGIELMVLDRDTWEQISLADAVYAELTGRATDTGPNTGTQGGRTEDEVVIRVGPLDWHTIVLGAGPSLAALRQVTTPDGLVVQGFVVGAEGVGEWLGSRASFAPLASPEPGIVSVPVADTEWQLAMDAGPALQGAQAEGREIVRQFRRAFGFTSTGALLAALAVVAIVAQTERLAHQRARFAAAAAHELKTPLTSLRLHGEMLAEGLGDPDRWPTYAARILPETQRLGRVVSNMLDLSRLERGASLANPVDGDLGEAVAACVARVRPALEDAGMTVNLDIEEHLPPVRFDRDAVSQILVNLLDNAEKYSRSSVDRRVAIRVARGPDEARITVSDNGPGISRRARHGLFRPFGRPADADAPAGLGLGLALARSLATAQGGELRLLDGHAPGAVFELRLPLSSF